MIHGTLVGLKFIPGLISVQPPGYRKAVLVPGTFVNGSALDCMFITPEGDICKARKFDFDRGVIIPKEITKIGKIEIPKGDYDVFVSNDRWFLVRNIRSEEGQDFTTFYGIVGGNSEYINNGNVLIINRRDGRIAKNVTEARLVNCIVDKNDQLISFLCIEEDDYHGGAVVYTATNRYRWDIPRISCCESYVDDMNNVMAICKCKNSEIFVFVSRNGEEPCGYLISSEHSSTVFEDFLELMRIVDVNAVPTVAEAYFSVKKLKPLV